MAEMLWGFKSPLSHRLMRRILFIITLSFLLQGAGCIKGPDNWFLQFRGLNQTCMTATSKDVINNLKYQAQQGLSRESGLFVKSLLKVFSMQDIHIVPYTSKHPDHVTLFSGHRPNYSLALERRGWSYCLDVVLSSALFTPLRKVRY